MNEPGATQAPAQLSLKAARKVALAALVGSQVKLSATLNKPVRRAEHVSPRGETAAAPSNSAARAEWTFQVQPEHSGEWAFRFADTYGFTNAPISRLLRAIPDRSPRVPAETKASSFTFRLRVPSLSTTHSEGALPSFRAK